MHDVIRAKEKEEREKRNPPHTPFPAIFLYENKKERTRLPLSIAGTKVFFFSSAENKKEKRKRKSLLRIFSLLYGKSDGKSFPLFFLKQEKKKTGNKIIILYLIFPSGRHGCPSFLY